MLRFPARTQSPETLQATLTDRQCDHQPTEKKPAAHFSTFGFARHTSRPLAKPKELKFSNRTRLVTATSTTTSKIDLAEIINPKRSVLF